jgi:hypothetical protein
VCGECLCVCVVMCTRVYEVCFMCVCGLFAPTQVPQYSCRRQVVVDDDFLEAHNSPSAQGTAPAMLLRLPSSPTAMTLLEDCIVQDLGQYFTPVSGISIFLTPHVLLSWSPGARWLPGTSPNPSLIQSVASFIVHFFFQSVCATI